ncbi:oligosaccharide flippase family protein [Haladaptatus sp. DYSN1]|uniref:oligosaccharide flippase family protein n=1 Tax=unclassified Haladaptatus TaxID=2622732 RepID=UPI002404E55F|nr:oligosaccharide flippase family protein [Haladaptatus sp. DYSN1]
MGSVDRASFALFGSRILSQLLGFVSVIYFAQQIGAEGLGVYFTFVTVVSVTGVFSKLGLPGAVVKRMNQATNAHDRGKYLSGSFVLLTVPFVITGGLLLLFGPHLTDYVGLAAAAPLAVAGVAMAVSSNLLSSALRGENRVATTAVLELLDQVSRLTISVGLLLAGWGVLALVLGRILGNVIKGIASYVVLETSFSIPTLETLTSLFDFSKYTVGMNVSSLAYNWADTLVLAAFATKAAVGIYETVWMVSAVTLLAAQVIGISLAPSMTRWHEAGQLYRVERGFTQGLSFALILVFPALIGAYLIGDSLLQTLYGYSAGTTILLILLTGQISEGVKNITQNTLFGIDQPEHVFWTNILTLGANVVLNLILVPPFGMLGAAAATFTTATVAAVSQVYYLRQYIELRVDHTTLVWQAGGAIVMGVVVAALTGVFPLGTELGLFALVGIGGLVYGGVILTNDTMRERLLGAGPF